MRYKKYLSIIYICLQIIPCKSQITILAKDTNTSMRGLCAVDDKVVWACGSKGWIAKSVDGKNFRFWQPKGYEKCEFRDVEAFDSSTAYVLAVTRPAIILKTTNGGNTWIETYRSEDTNIFLDAISFWDKKHGMAVGDPINGKIVLLWMDGIKWNNYYLKPNLLPDESMFAASGSCFIYHYFDYAFVTGGSISRFFYCKDCDNPIDYIKRDTHSVIINNKYIQQGNSGKGTFSFCRNTQRENSYILVGGDYTQESLAEKNAVIIENKDQFVPTKLPGGYRECVIWGGGKYYICCGPNGVDISKDGDVWEPYSKEGFHVVQKAKKGKKIFLAGGKGKIGVIESIK